MIAGGKVPALQPAGFPRIMSGLRRAPHQAACHPLAAWCLAAVYVAYGAHHVLTNRFLNDEGLLTYYFAGMLWEAPLDIFFWQKSRPILSLLYAPAAASSLTLFLLVHVIVASLSGPLTAAVARGWKHRFPNLAALLVLASPLMVGAGPAGVANTDATTLAVLALWFATRNRPVVAGVVLGSLCFIRAELILLMVVLSSLGAFERRYRGVVFGTIAFAVVYGLLGIFYHHDVLWILHYPPSLTSGKPANSMFEQMATPTTIWETAPVLMALTPAVGIAALAGWRNLTLIERAGALFALVFLVSIRLLPYVGLFNFGSMPRYVLPALPFLALMASRAFSVWHNDSDRWWSTAWLAGLLIVGHFADTKAQWPWFLLAVAGWSALVLLARLRRVSVAVALAGVAAVVPVPWLLPTTDLAVADVRRGLVPAIGWFAQHPEVVRSGPVLTNMHLLSTYAQRTNRLPGLEVHQLVQSDQLFELIELSNPEVGQRDVIMKLLDDHFYGKPVFPRALHPDRLPEGTVFILSNDERLESVMPKALWEARLKTLATSDHWRVVSLRAKP